MLALEAAGVGARRWITQLEEVTSLLRYDLKVSRSEAAVPSHQARAYSHRNRELLEVIGLAGVQSYKLLRAVKAVGTIISQRKFINEVIGCSCL